MKSKAVGRQEISREMRFSIKGPGETQDDSGISGKTRGSEGLAMPILVLSPTTL